MAAFPDFTAVWPDASDGPAPRNRPSRVRVLTAVLLLIAIGLLAAASVLASRPYPPAHHAVGGGQGSTHPVGERATPGSRPDPC